MHVRQHGGGVEQAAEVSAEATSDDGGAVETEATVEVEAGA